MKKTISLIALVLLSCSVFSQIDHIKILVGYPETDVIKYFDSLNTLKNDPVYKINRTVSDSGGLVLSCMFSIENENFYNCETISVKFLRENGVAYCITQLITGDALSAQTNFAYIKENFKTTASGAWEQKLPGTGFKVVASLFSRQEGGKELFKLRYDLKNDQ